MNVSFLHKALYQWYEQNKRVLPWRDTDNAYAVWISEIILQQTRVAQGMDYFLRFIATFPNVACLAAAKEDEVLRLWQGLGYYSRARNLHKAAQVIVERGWLPFPKSFEQIRQLPGVGDYTAGAIASFAYNLPYPAMDGNVYRVVSRLFDCDIPFDTTQGKKHFHALIAQILDNDHACLFNAAIMEFGALYCTPSLTDAQTGVSVCEQCPLQSQCLSYAHHTSSLLPVRKPRTALRDRYLNYLIYISSSQSQPFTLIQQRCKKDIWQHLYEFPLYESEGALLDDYSQAQSALLSSYENADSTHLSSSHIPQSTALDIPHTTSLNKVFSMDFTHVLSHQRLHARFFVIIVDALPTIPSTMPIAWADREDYAFSALTLKAIAALPIE